MSLIKGLFGFTLLALIGMLYWSSWLHEHDMKLLRQEMKELRVENAAIGHKLTRELHHLSHQNWSVKEGPLSVHTQAASTYPNLLTDDAYYTNTLPKLLGDQFQTKGILRRALIGKPENLHPFNGFRDVLEMIQMCNGSVADTKTGCYETMAPNLAIRLEARPRSDEPDLEEYWVQLREDLYWEPLNPTHFPDALTLAPQFLTRQPVTAADFKFFYDAIMNPYLHEAKAASLRTYFSDIEAFIVVDERTFIVRWRSHVSVDDEGRPTKKIKYTSLGLTGALQPLPRFVYQYFADGQKIIEEGDDPEIYKKSSIWAQNFSQHWAKNIIVCCGPYLFDGMNEEGISFKRNPHFFNPYAVLVEGVKYRFKEGFDAVWQDFKTGKIDLCVLAPNQIMEFHKFLQSDEYKSQAAHNRSIKTLDYTDLSFYYIGWNQAKPFFKERLVRQALTLAIDRNRIIEQNLNLMALPITGPFCHTSSAYDTSIADYPYNPEEARRLLEEVGWIDIDGDGIRDRFIDGEKISFRFKLNYFIKSLSSKVIAEYISTALRDVGIECELSGVDIADLSRQFEDKSFDAIFMGWKLGSPPEDPRQLWHSSGAREKGSSNAIGFENQEVDRLIELLNYEYNKSKRIPLYHQFHHIIYQEAPYTFLYTPKVRVIYREHVKNIFIPSERQDLIPEADVPEPYTHAIWLADETVGWGGH